MLMSRELYVQRAGWRNRVVTSAKRTSVNDVTMYLVAFNILPLPALSKSLCCLHTVVSLASRICSAR